MALRLAPRVPRRARRAPSRWRIVSPAQAYHGATLGDARADRPARRSSGPTSLTWPSHLHVPPSTRRFDESGEEALAELDRVARARRGPETIAAFFCEPVSAAALPAYSPPARFWEGLAERRERHGFLVCFDEIVTGVRPDGNVVRGRPAAARARHRHLREGPRRRLRAARRHPLPRARLRGCRVRLAELRARPHVGRRAPDLRRRARRARRARARAASSSGWPSEARACATSSQSALAGFEIVGEVRGPRLPPRRRARRPARRRVVPPRRAAGGCARRHDRARARPARHVVALDAGRLRRGRRRCSLPRTRATDEELAEMVERFAATLADVERTVKEKLAMSQTDLSDLTGPRGGSAGTRPGSTSCSAMPDLNGYLRGKALSRGRVRGGRPGRHGHDRPPARASTPSTRPSPTTRASASARAPATSSSTRTLDTLHELTWRPGWSVCLSTPTWRDGERCELSVARDAPATRSPAMADLGYDVARRLRVRDPDLATRRASRSRAGSATASSRPGATTSSSRSSRPRSEALGVELSAVHTEAGPGLLELNLAAQRRLRAADDAAYVKLAVKESPRRSASAPASSPRPSPGEEGSSGHVHLSCWRTARTPSRRSPTASCRRPARPRSPGSSSTSPAPPSS